MMEQDSYLLQNQVNPFPISGQLVLDDDGHLRFSLDEGAAGCKLGWLEKATGEQGPKERIEGGERPVMFDLSVAGRKISWPMSLGGYGLKFEDDQRKWTVTLNYPSGGAIWQLINMAGSRGTTPPAGVRCRLVTGEYYPDRRCCEVGAVVKCGADHAAGRVQPCGGSNFDVRTYPAARPLPAMTSAILREASSIISSPTIAEPFFPPASDV